MRREPGAPAGDSIRSPTQTLGRMPECVDATVRLHTVADFAPDRFRMLVYCDGCKSCRMLDRTALQLDLPIPTLRAHLVCSACESCRTP